MPRPYEITQFAAYDRYHALVLESYRRLKSNGRGHTSGQPTDSLRYKGTRYFFMFLATRDITIPNLI